MPARAGDYTCPVNDLLQSRYQQRTRVVKVEPAKFVVLRASKRWINRQAHFARAQSRDVVARDLSTRVRLGLAEFLPPREIEVSEARLLCRLTDCGGEGFLPSFNESLRKIPMTKCAQAQHVRSVLS